MRIFNLIYRHSRNYQYEIPKITQPAGVLPVDPETTREQVLELGFPAGARAGLRETFIVAPSYQIWLPSDVSVHGRTIDKLFYFILILTGVVFVATEGALFWFMWKYNNRSNTEPVKFTHGSHTLELVWTILPAATLLFISLYQMDAWAANEELRRPEMAPTAEVTGRRFEWRIRYPGDDGELGTQDDIFYVNELICLWVKEIFACRKKPGRVAQLLPAKPAGQTGPCARHEAIHLVQGYRERRIRYCLRGIMRLGPLQNAGADRAQNRKPNTTPG